MAFSVRCNETWLSNILRAKAKRLQSSTARVVEVSAVLQKVDVFRDAVRVGLGCGPPPQGHGNRLTRPGSIFEKPSGVQTDVSTLGISHAHERIHNVALIGPSGEKYNPVRDAWGHIR